MPLSWRVSPEKILDRVELEKVSRAVALLKLTDGKVIDSHSMSPNGPTLESVFVVSGTYFIEIGMGGKHLEFDVAHTRKLVNYRVTFNEHGQTTERAVASLESTATTESAPAPSPEILKITKFVTVNLRHTDSLVSSMSYFGDDIEAWLDYVLDAFPPSNLLTYPS